MCQQHPQPKCPLTSSNVPAHRQKSSPQTLHPHCTYPAHNVDETIIVICFFKMTCSTLLVSNRTRKFPNTLLVFFHNCRHSRNNTNIWRQSHCWCSFINHQFPLRWTWHTLSEKSGRSTLRTRHSDLVQGVANNFTWWIHICIHKIPNYFYSKVWLICLPALTSACIFKDTLRNHTQVFLKFRNSILEICLRLIKLNCTLHFLPSLMLSSGAGTSKDIPLQENGFALPAMLITLPTSIYWNQLLRSDNLIFKFNNPQDGI